MANEFYDILINGLPQELTVTEFVQGISWMAARLSDGNVGIAANLDGAAVESPVGMYARDAAMMVLDSNQKAASMGMAVINAYYNSVSRAEKFGCLVPREAVCTDGMDICGKTIGMLGHMKRTADMLTAAKKLYIFEFDPKPGDLPANEEARLLPECDIVIASGTVIANHTQPGIIKMSQKADIILLGPSVPMCPSLPDVCRLCGSVVTRGDELLAWAGNSAGSPLPFTESFILDVMR